MRLHFFPLQKQDKGASTKIPCRKPCPKEIDQKLDVSFSLTFLFYHVFGWFSAMEVQKDYKKAFDKKSCRKAKSCSKPTANRPKNYTRLPAAAAFLVSRFSVMSDERRGEFKNAININKNKSKSDPRPQTPGPRPWALGLFLVVGYWLLATARGTQTK
jgi:hypothetical protein